MSEMNEIIRSTLDSIKGFANVESVIGDIINTPSGLTLIPISKITVGFVGGGADYGNTAFVSAPPGKISRELHFTEDIHGRPFLNEHKKACAACRPHAPAHA